jgi:hypothetical protein
MISVAVRAPGNTTTSAFFALATTSGTNPGLVRKPISSSNIVRRHLHPALKALNYVNPFTGDHKAGNHAFRRFRITFLRNYTSCPDGLQKFWLGHAGETMTDLYDKVKEDKQFRLEWAEKCGIGSELPEFGLSIVPKVPNVPKSEGMEEAACAA